MSAPDNPVLLTEVPTEHEAIMLRDALAEHGIRAVYNGAAIAGFRAETPAWVRLLVSESDRDKARELIDKHQLVSKEPVDWSQVDVGEPEDASE